MKHYIIHYGEIALKNKNRSFFENLLKGRILSECAKVAPCTVRRLPGRIWAEFAAPPDHKNISSRLSKIFGLVNFIPCLRAEPSLTELKKTLGFILKTKKILSFAVRAKRGEKNFPVSSQYVNEEIGRFVQEETGGRVDLDAPETTIYIELFQNHIFCGFEKVEGPRGLPVGSAGKIASLLSGGIDSPVAAWRMMKRGATSLFIHFHSAPFAPPESEEKALDLAELLSSFQGESRLLLVPFGETQRQIVAKCPEEFRILLYRRMMFRIASHLAREENCLGLVTGESLSQVASQTLSNLGAIESAATLPLFRPLIGMDKEEIVDQAKKIGTYPISIRPHEDCCSFMIPRHPKTGSRKEDLERMERDLDIDGMTQKGIKEARACELSGEY